jgi:UDP-N-acetylmuramoylalanine--D-glutamate ligase
MTLKTTPFLLKQLIRHCEDKRAVILGAARSGLAAAEVLAMHGADVVLADDNASAVPQGIELHIGIDASLLEGTDLIVLSPGIPRSHPTIIEAMRRDIPVVNEMDVAQVFLPETNFVGITGTNGKSTTTSMLGSILKAHTNQTFVGGNLGLPLCKACLKLEKPTHAAVELSSFQLETLSLLELDAAIITNFAPDHLNRYDSVDAYYRAKMRIIQLLKPGKNLILNAADPVLMRFSREFSDGAIQFNFNTKPGESGVRLEANSAIITKHGQETHIALDSPNIIGHHNKENAAAAIAAAVTLGLDGATIQKGLNQYAGIAHRLEVLGQIHGVLWVNDSKATNVPAAMVGIQSFGKGIHLLAGGRGKHEDFTPLANTCKNRVDAIYLFGETKEELAQALGDSAPVYTFTDMKGALEMAKKNAVPGNVILLCPACASFDQFLNFEERGERFKDEFKKTAANS